MSDSINNEQETSQNETSETLAQAASGHFGTGKQILDFDDDFEEGNAADDDFDFAEREHSTQKADDVFESLEQSLGTIWREQTALEQQDGKISTNKRPLPDGDYSVEVEKLWIGRRERDNVASPIVFAWRCRVLMGEYEGAQVSHRVAASQWTILVIRRDMELAGLPPETSFADIRLVQESFKGLRFRLRVKTQEWTAGRFERKTYLNARLADGVDLASDLKKAQKAHVVQVNEICPL